MGIRRSGALPPRLRLRSLCAAPGGGQPGPSEGAQYAGGEAGPGLGPHSATGPRGSSPGRPRPAGGVGEGRDDPGGPAGHEPGLAAAAAECRVGPPSIFSALTLHDDFVVRLDRLLATQKRAR